MTINDNNACGKWQKNYSAICSMKLEALQLPKALWVNNMLRF